MFGIKRPTNNDEEQPAETTCKKCGNKVLVSNLRMNPETRTVMCYSCVKASSQNGNPEAPKPFAKIVSPFGQKPAPTVGQKPASVFGQRPASTTSQKPAVHPAAASALSAFAASAGITASQSAGPSAPSQRSTTPSSSAPSMASSRPASPSPMPSARPSAPTTSSSSGSVFQRSSNGPSSDDDGKTKKKCPRCNFVFTFDTVKQYPKFCPYCREKIV